MIKKKEDSQFYKSGINIEYIQNNVRKSLVREYTYLRKIKRINSSRGGRESRNFEKQIYQDSKVGNIIQH